MRFPHSHSSDDDSCVTLYKPNERSPSHYLSPSGSSFDEKMLNTVALQGLVCGAAVGAAAPSGLERGPLLVAEIVLDTGHSPLAFAGASGPTAPIDRHRAIVGAVTMPPRRLVT